MERKINYKSIWCFILLLLFSVIIFPIRAYAIPSYDGVINLGQKSVSASVSGSKNLLVIGVDYADAPATYTAEQI